MQWEVDWSTQNEGITFHDTPTARELGELQGRADLLAYYAVKHPAPPNTWLQRIANGQIKLNGQVCSEPGTTLRVNDRLQYYRLPFEEPAAPSVLPILHMDAHLVAVNKPAGLQVLPGGPFHQRCVATILQWAAQGQGPVRGPPVPGNMAPVPVHRLGRGTSGLLLCAISKEARRHLSMAFESKTASVGPAAGQAEGRAAGKAAGQQMCKVYLALVQGRVEGNEGVVTQHIGRVPWPGVRGGLYAAHNQGLAAESHWRKLQYCEVGQSTLLEVSIVTGRPHQVRIHMAYLGHPLVGDPLYAVGGCPRAGPSHQAAAHLSADKCDLQHNEAHASLVQSPTQGHEVSSALASSTCPQQANHAAGAHGGEKRGSAACVHAPVRDIDPQSEVVCATATEGGNEDNRIQRSLHTTATCSIPTAAGVHAPQHDNQPRTAACAGAPQHRTPLCSQSESGTSAVMPGDIGYCLHAWKVTLVHPGTQQRMELEAPPPPWATINNCGAHADVFH